MRSSFSTTSRPGASALGAAKAAEAAKAVNAVSPDALTDLAGENRFQALVFSLEPDSESHPSERYCINVFKVREIVSSEAHPVSRIPSLSGNKLVGFDGVANIRGEFIPVIDLGEVLGLAPAPRNLMMVTEFGSRKLIFRLHNVLEMRAVDGQHVHNAKAVLGEQASRFVTALVKLPPSNGQPGIQATQLDVEAVLGLFHDVESDGKVGDLPRIQGSHTVLFADDSATARSVVAALLQDLGVRGVEAVDGQDAWNKLSAGAVSPSAIITDIEMPVMDGYALTRRLKEHPTLKAIPVIMYSSLSAQENVRAGREVGADAYVAKFNRQALYDALEPFLR